MTAKTKHLSKLVLVAVGAYLLFASVGCIFGGPASRGPSQAAQQQASGPPDWASWTIILQRVRKDRDHSPAEARHSLQRIRKQTRWPDLHVLQIDQFSMVCRGYFRNYTDDKAQRMLRQVREYRDSQGRELFRHASFAPLPRKKRRITNGPPQWDLRRAPGNASLCIGFFINDETCKDRLAAAVKKVTALRSRGVEAWYYHGQDRSGVYVGHFNADWQWVTVGKTRADKSIKRKMFVTHDPQFKILRKKFPKYRENGQALGFKVGKRQAYDAPILVSIPRLDQKITDAEMGLH